MFFTATLNGLGGCTPIAATSQRSAPLLLLPSVLVAPSVALPLPAPSCRCSEASAAGPTTSTMTPFSSGLFTRPVRSTRTPARSGPQWGLCCGHALRWQSLEQYHAIPQVLHLSNCTALGASGVLTCGPGAAAAAPPSWLGPAGGGAAADLCAPHQSQLDPPTDRLLNMARISSGSAAVPFGTTTAWVLILLGSSTPPLLRPSRAARLLRAVSSIPSMITPQLSSTIPRRGHEICSSRARSLSSAALPTSMALWYALAAPWRSARSRRANPRVNQACVRTAAEACVFDPRDLRNARSSGVGLMLSCRIKLVKPLMQQ
mmetsp:Transcript_14067/g.30481  ORF Transcript_14067/g.30481 Transcript_14067/m.30481 type:complete len:317 (-) Transcript_14067:314-1264(-)